MTSAWECQRYSVTMAATFFASGIGSSPGWHTELTSYRGVLHLLLCRLRLSAGLGPGAKLQAAVVSGSLPFRLLSGAQRLFHLRSFRHTEQARAHALDQAASDQAAAAVEDVVDFVIIR